MHALCPPPTLVDDNKKSHVLKPISKALLQTFLKSQSKSLTSIFVHNQQRSRVLVHRQSYDSTAAALVAKREVRTCKKTISYDLPHVTGNTSTEVSGDLAVTVAPGADPSPEDLSGEPEKSTASTGLVTEVAAELAHVSAAHEAEATVAGAALGGVAAGEVEGARPRQPLAILAHVAHRRHDCRRN